MVPTARSTPRDVYYAAMRERRKSRSRQSIPVDLGEHPTFQAVGRLAALRDQRPSIVTEPLFRRLLDWAWTRYLRATDVFGDDEDTGYRVATDARAERQQMGICY